MNWLAHVFLSEKNIDYQLGNLLADPLKARTWPDASQGVVDGIKMHTKIDSFTDSHASVSKSKARLGKKGYLKPVIIDIVYDHFLHKHWDTYADERLDDFISNFYQEAEVAIQSYPDQAKRFVQRVIQSNVLTSYHSNAGIAQALGRIDNRLSERVLKKETASQYMPVVKDELENIEKDFKEFFPELIEFTKQQN